MKRCRYEIQLFLQRLLVAWKYPYTAIARDTSNGGYRRGEKSCKHWSFFTMLSSLVIANLFVRLDKKIIVCIKCTENQRKIELNPMS